MLVLFISPLMAQSKFASSLPVRPTWIWRTYARVNQPGNASAGLGCPGYIGFVKTNKDMDDQKDAFRHYAQHYAGVDASMPFLTIRLCRIL
jgi:hypothetical protein